MKVKDKLLEQKNDSNQCVYDHYEIYSFACQLTLYISCKVASTYV